MSEQTSTRARRRGQASDQWLPWAIVVGVLGALLVAYARLRWPGLLPLGSDNDEYLLVGGALADFEAPVVAGVEGTKYPLGFPLLLAVFEWLRLPVASAALVTNVMALAATTGMVAWLAGRATARLPASPAAALAAGGVVVASASVWNDMFSVMPEILLLAVSAAALTTMAAPVNVRRVGIVTALAAVAVALKTLALPLFVGGAAVWWLAARTGASQLVVAAASTARWRSPNVALLPAMSAVFIAAVGHLIMLPFPEHTTGYLATFTLVDPNDASQGHLDVAGMIARSIEGAPEALRYLGRSIALIDADAGVSIAIAVIALVVGVVGAFRLRRGTPLGLFAAGAVSAHVVAMVLWPYTTSRFSLPLLPISALGAGWLIRLVGQAAGRGAHGAGGARPVDDAPSSTSRADAVSSVFAFVLVGALVATSWGPVSQRADSAEAALSAQHQALDVVAEWADALPADAELVSFDYREVSRRVGRDVEPIGYTSNPAVLLSQTDGADYLVVMEFYAKRNAQARILLDAYPGRFTEMLSADDVAIYGIDASSPH